MRYHEVFELMRFIFNLYIKLQHSFSTMKTKTSLKARQENKFFAPYLFGENATIPPRCVCSCYAWWIFREIFWRQFQLSSPAFEMTNFTISIISGFCLHSFNTQRRRRNYLGQYWYTSIHSSKFLLLKKSCLLEEGRYWSSQLDWRLTEHCRYSTHSEK